MLPFSQQPTIPLSPRYSLSLEESYEPEESQSFPEEIYRFPEESRSFPEESEMMDISSEEEVIEKFEKIVLPPAPKRSEPVSRIQPIKKEEVEEVIEKFQKLTLPPAPKRREVVNQITPFEIFDYLGWNTIDPEIFYFDENIDDFIPLEQAPQSFLNVYYNGNLGTLINFKLPVGQDKYTNTFILNKKGITPDRVMKYLNKFYNKKMFGDEDLYSMKTNKRVENYYSNEYPTYGMKGTAFVGIDLEEGINPTYKVLLK